MANKLRSVNTKFWDDSFTSELTPTEKLLFLYLITNPLTKLVGIYEISLKRICFDTGMNTKMVQDGLKRFETVRKAFFIENYIILPNWLKHQNLNSNMKKAVIKEFALLPEWLRTKILDNDEETVSNDYETILNHLQTVRKEEVEDEVEDELKHKDKNHLHFYASELIISNNDATYSKFINWLTTDNNILKRPLKNVLEMKEQIGWNQFTGLTELMSKPENERIKVSEIIVEMENWLMANPKKKGQGFLGTLRTFVNNKKK